MSNRAQHARGLRSVRGWAPICRAVLGWLVLCAGVGIAITLARFTADSFDAPPGVVPLLQAILVTALVVPAIVALRRKLDRAPLGGLGLSRRMRRSTLLGLGVGVGSAVVVWLPAIAVGWIRVDSVDVITLLAFLAVNSVVLLLYEALPEELALRGYAWSNIRDGWSPWVATMIVTLLFCMSSMAISVVQAATAVLLGVETSGPSFAPQGTDPVVYVVQLVVFGLALCAARRVPVRGALGAAIGFHIAQLTITRMLLGGLSWIDSGVGVEFIQPDVIALVLVHIALGGLSFVALRLLIVRRKHRGPGSRPV